MVARATLLSICLYFALSTAVPIPPRFPDGQNIQPFNGHRPHSHHHHHHPSRDSEYRLGELRHQKREVHDDFPHPRGRRHHAHGPHNRDGRPEDFERVKHDFLEKYHEHHEHPDLFHKTHKDIDRDIHRVVKRHLPGQDEGRYEPIDGPIRKDDRDLREDPRDRLRKPDGLGPEFRRPDERRPRFGNLKRDMHERHRERLHGAGPFDDHRMEGERDRMDGREHYKRDGERIFRPEQHNHHPEQHEFRHSEERGPWRFEHEKRYFSELPEQREEPRSRLGRDDKHPMEELGRVDGQRQFKGHADDFHFPQGQRGIEQMDRFPEEEGDQRHKDGRHIPKA